MVKYNRYQIYKAERCEVISDTILYYRLFNFSQRCSVWLVLNRNPFGLRKYLFKANNKGKEMFFFYENSNIKWENKSFIPPPSSLNRIKESLNRHIKNLPNLLSNIEKDYGIENIQNS
jgi:hypothetical protein